MTTFEEMLARRPVDPERLNAQVQEMHAETQLYQPKKPLKNAGMTTEAGMVALLKKRYSGTSTAGLPRYITASQVPLFSEGAHRRIDFIAVDSMTEEVMLPADTAYTRLPPPVHGFEVKVSRADWLTEHKTSGKKSEPWRWYCDYWWMVVPNQKIIKPGELPAGWGLLVGEKQLRAVAKPSRSLDTQPLDMELMRTIARYSQRKQL